jgi:hypothetical protein
MVYFQASVTLAIHNSYSKGRQKLAMDKMFLLRPRVRSNRPSRR